MFQADPAVQNLWAACLLHRMQQTQSRHAGGTFHDTEAPESKGVQRAPPQPVARPVGVLAHAREVPCSRWKLACCNVGRGRSIQIPHCEVNPLAQSLGWRASDSSAIAWLLGARQCHRLASLGQLVPHLGTVDRRRTSHAKPLCGSMSTTPWVNTRTSTSCGCLHSWSTGA